jgi:hypothetical protein
MIVPNGQRSGRPARERISRAEDEGEHATAEESKAAHQREKRTHERAVEVHEHAAEAHERASELNEEPSDCFCGAARLARLPCGGVFVAWGVRQPAQAAAICIDDPQVEVGTVHPLEDDP